MNLFSCMPLPIIQWIFDHPQDIANSLKLAWNIWRRIRAKQKRRKKKNLEKNSPGSNHFVGNQ